MAGGINAFDSMLVSKAGLDVTKNGKGGKPANFDQVRAAFETQMNMTSSLFSEGRPDSMSGGVMALDNSIMNDALMMDTLSTLARLLQGGGKMNLARAAKAYQAVKASQPAAANKTNMDALNTLSEPVKKDIGTLSAMFESGKKGVSAIGYDKVGGTSYGIYQIASKPGTMGKFLDYLDKHAPEWGKKLRLAGPANTGSKDGNMPTAWKEIAAEDAKKFTQLQHDFIKAGSYDPARKMILGSTGIDMDNAPSVLRDVLWSTAVQHGPTGASKIFDRVIKAFTSGGGKDFNASLIEGVYDQRKGQFGSSTARVRDAVHDRLTNEKQLALNLLGGVNKTV